MLEEYKFLGNTQQVIAKMNERQTMGMTRFDWFFASQMHAQRMIHPTRDLNENDLIQAMDEALAMETLAQELDQKRREATANGQNQNHQKNASTEGGAAAAGDAGECQDPRLDPGGS